MGAVQNLPQVKNNLKLAVQQKLRKFTIGLKKGGRLIQRESQKIVPVDTGNLKASAFTRVEGDGTPIVVVSVGYTAAYAIRVHENLQALHGAAFNIAYAKELADARAAKRRGESVTGPFRHNRGPDQQAKFLEVPFRRLRGQVLLICAAEMKI